MAGLHNLIQQDAYISAGCSEHDLEQFLGHHIPKLLFVSDCDSKSLYLKTTDSHQAYNLHGHPLPECYRRSLHGEVRDIPWIQNQDCHQLSVLGVTLRRRWTTALSRTYVFKFVPAAWWPPKKPSPQTVTFLAFLLHWVPVLRLAIGNRVNWEPDFNTLPEAPLLIIRLFGSIWTILWSIYFVSHCARSILKPGFRAVSAFAVMLHTRNLTPKWPVILTVFIPSR